MARQDQSTPAAADIPDDLIEMRQAARAAKCHLATAYRWILSGRLRSWKRAGRRFVSRAELLALFVPVPPREGARHVPGPTRQQQERETAATLRKYGME
jgi:hypothetical protein